MIAFSASSVDSPSHGSGSSECELKNLFFSFPLGSHWPVKNSHPTQQRPEECEEQFFRLAFTGSEYVIDRFLKKGFFSSSDPHLKKSVYEKNSFDGGRIKYNLENDKSSFYLSFKQNFRKSNHEKSVKTLKRVRIRIR